MIALPRAFLSPRSGEGIYGTSVDVWATAPAHVHVKLGHICAIHPAHVHEKSGHVCAVPPAHVCDTVSILLEWSMSVSSNDYIRVNGIVLPDLYGDYCMSGQGLQHFTGRIGIQ